MYLKAYRDVIGAINLWHVWLYQAYHAISAKYKRTALGSLWISGSMVVTSLSLAIVFGGIFGQSLKEALPYIMAGMICFGFAGYPLIEGQETIVSNGGVIKNHAYPFSFYIFEATCKNAIMFFHNLVVFYITLFILGAQVIPNWTVLPAILVAIIYMVIWSTITSMMAARYRDLRFLLPYIGQLMSFVTPIFWRADLLNGPRRAIIDFNPVYGILEIIRAPLLGSAASLHTWVLALSAVCIGLIVWILFFPKFRSKIPFWV